MLLVEKGRTNKLNSELLYKHNVTNVVQLNGLRLVKQSCIHNYYYLFTALNEGQAYGILLKHICQWYIPFTGQRQHSLF
jgi:lipoprotein signal peptidase